MVGNIFGVNLMKLGRTLPSDPHEDSIIFVTETIMAGIPIPLPWEVFWMLNELDLALEHLSLNAFQILVGTMLLFKLKGQRNLIMERFQMLYQIKDNHDSSGIYLFSS